MNTYEQLRAKYVTPHHRERRQLLVEEMNKLSGQEYHCQSCQGLCCTYAHNSMQVTPLQALDAYVYLREHKGPNQQTLITLDQCIKKYRLDIEIHIGKMNELRKNYTCPFYNESFKGCGISRQYKPYGCLGFNPLEKNVSKAGKCGSNNELLELREQSYNEEKMNNEIKEELNIYWDKKNFPVALRVMIDKLGE